MAHKEPCSKQTKLAILRIIEPLRLKKTFNIKSNCEPSTAKPTAKPCPYAPHLHILLIPPGTVTQPLLWAACAMPDNPLSEDIFLYIQSKPHLVQLEAISSCPILCYLGEETAAHLTTHSLLSGSCREQ